MYVVRVSHQPAPVHVFFCPPVRVSGTLPWTPPTGRVHTGLSTADAGAFLFLFALGEVSSDAGALSAKLVIYMISVYLDDMHNMMSFSSSIPGQEADYRVELLAI